MPVPWRNSLAATVIRVTSGTQIRNFVIAITGAGKPSLVTTLARPGGNLTGVNFLNVEMTEKRLELLRDLVPGAVRVAVFVNPTNPNAKTIVIDVEAAARAMGLQSQVHNAYTVGEIDAAFATFVREQAEAPSDRLDEP